jgi:hypothetical protein
MNAHCSSLINEPAVVLREWLQAEQRAARIQQVGAVNHLYCVVSWKILNFFSS